MSEKSKAAWQAILDKKRKTVAENPDNVAVSGNPDMPVTKKGSTCGNPACCMKQSRENVTYEGPSVISPDGYTVSGYNFKLEPPMLCSGDAWMPRQLTKWERARREAKTATGLAAFKKK